VTAARDLAVARGAPPGDRDGTRLVPMLCERDDTSGRLLAQPGWLYELKLDGVRIVADKRGERVSLGYRKGRDATESYPEIALAVSRLPEARLVLDGEIIAFDDRGRPDFQRLGTRIQRSFSAATAAEALRAARQTPVVYVVFDLLVVGDRDVTSLPIEHRKELLERVLGEASTAGSLLRLHPTLADGAALFAFCREHALEGVVAKRAGSPYRADARSRDWVKVKRELEADLVVVGWTEGEGDRARLGALEVAAYDGARLVVQGRVGSGLTEEVITPLLARLQALEIAASAAPVASLKKKRGRHHVSPELVVSVRYAGLSKSGVLRFPVFRGLRPDVDPEECTTLAMRLGFVRDPGAR
jgi:bifunctional non-homologous end joining protein LigD